MKMHRLNPKKLHVTHLSGIETNSPLIPRRYTLTHSDFTGNLYLTIGRDYLWGQISNWYTRFMRDEVLAEWNDDKGEMTLNVHCHVGGGIILGWAGLRDTIFRRELPLALEALRFGDHGLFDTHPKLNHALIRVSFHAKEQKYNVMEYWGKPADYC